MHDVIGCIYNDVLDVPMTGTTAVAFGLRVCLSPICGTPPVSAARPITGAGHSSRSNRGHADLLRLPSMGGTHLAASL